MKIIELKNLIIKYYPGKGSDLLNSVLFDIFSCEQELASHSIIEDHMFTPTIMELERKISTDHER